MEILLVNDVIGLGDIGDKISVKPGYARNFLIPRGFAVEAHAGSSKAINHRMLQIAAKKKKLKLEAEQACEEWKKVTISLTLKVGDGNKVFGSISTRDIAEALNAKGKKVDRRQIILQEPIRKLGKQEVNIKLHSEVIGVFTVDVSAQSALSDEERKAAVDAKSKMDQAKKKRKPKAEETN